MKTKGIQHLSLPVKDLKQSSFFYQEVLGMEEIFRDAQRVFLQAEKDLLVLEQSDPFSSREFHFGFWAEDEDHLQEWKKWLSEKGILLEKEVSLERGKSIYFRDPNDYEIEIFYFH